MATRKTSPGKTNAGKTPAGKTPRPTPRPATSPATGARRRLDLVLLGATGFTGRQAVRALLRQRPDAHWGIAGRDADRLQALVQQLAPARPPQLIVADTRDAAAMRSLARRTKVLVNLAGPYHATGDTVVAACIGAGTHYLDLSAETFWIQRLIREQHAAAERARVKIIPCAGYEALPFDLATLWAAEQLRRHAGEPCASVTIAVSLTGRPLLDPRDLVSGGTAASVLEILAHDRSDCLRDMGCLLPPGTPDAAGIARRNALHWVPRVDAALGTVLAPTLPGPFINPPVVLRGIALRHDAALFDPAFRYREGMHMGRLLRGSEQLPPRAAQALQWAGAASVALPMAQLSAAVAGPLQFQRNALRAVLQRLAPKPGRGPSEKALDAVGYELQVRARGARGARFAGRVVAQGHPGYRSTPEMVVCAALGLADGSLGRTPHYGIVSPAAGLGIEAVAALAAAGLRFEAGA